MSVRNTTMIIVKNVPKLVINVPKNAGKWQRNKYLQLQKHLFIHSGACFYGTFN
ncbi:hypothetical protein QFZ72_003390 [Bacillus sp. V2I10]|nr:hypothetical protein [Bacillus sp. V2I10]